MQRATVQRIARMYGLGTVQIAPVQKGYRNESYPLTLAVGRTVNLILYKREPGMLQTIRRLHAASLYLAQRGLAVRVPIDPRIMNVNGRTGVRYAALYSYLPGHTITWDGYTQKHLKVLGGAMSDMHAALQGYAGVGVPSVARQYAQIYQRMQMYFQDEQVTQPLRAKLGLCVSLTFMNQSTKLLGACDTLGKQQLLHMDFVRSNILFADDTATVTVAGVLDFEKLAYGHPLFDVARTLAFLLVDCTHRPASSVRGNFIDSGYRKRGAARLGRVVVRLPSGNTNLLDSLVSIFLLHDLYKFLRHNPYEYLDQNQHFLRTRNLLLERKVITTTPSYG